MNDADHEIKQEIDEPESPVENEPTPAPKKKKKGSRLGLVLAIVIPLLIIGAIGGMSVMVYTSPPDSGAVKFISDTFPYPAVKINSKTITMSEFLEERAALLTYFATLEGEEAPAEDELDEKIVETLINKVALELLAEEHGVELDQAKMDEIYEGIISGGDKEAFDKQLQETFGWEEAEFRERILKSVVLAIQMGEKISTDQDIQAAAKERIDSAVSALEEGQEFAEVAGETNTDMTAAVGGDIGEVPVIYLPPSWNEAVADLEDGQRTDIVETEDAFSILEVQTRDEEAESIHLSVIRVEKKTIEQVVDEFIESAEIKKYVGQG